MRKFWDVLTDREPADLLIENIRLLNPVTAEIQEGVLVIADGRIAGWHKRPAREILDGKGAIVSPGLIDAHIHVESSMLAPAEFARAVIPHGTTAVVADPHEVGNVAGIPGIDWMMTQGAHSPLRFFWAAPSCVPASPLDTPGYVLGVKEIEALLDREAVVSLGEVMNYPGVIHGDVSVHAKIDAAKRRGLAVDGHAPGVTGVDLETYAAAGIETDHECTTPDEAGEKLRLGMFIQMRQGSSAHNLSALLSLVKPVWSGRLMFATDDKNPVDLLEKGHLDEHLRMCVAKGIPPGEAVRMATLNPARHYRLPGLGSLTPGSRADLTFFRDLKMFEATRVMIAGKTVYADGEFLEDWKGLEGTITSSMHLQTISGDTLRVKRTGDVMKVIGINPGQLVTKMEYAAVPAMKEVVSDIDRDILKIAVFERHHGTGNVGVGFVRGLGLKSGAFATTVAHDSHHLIVTGTNDADILKAARECVAMKGGVAVVNKGVLLATLPLPLFGLISDKPFAGVTRGFREVHESLKRLGSPLSDPLMQVSFLALPVIPALKITDKGLVDVDSFKHVPLFGK